MTMHIELLKSHTHASTDHLPGSVLELEDDQAHWLIDIGSARRAADAAGPANISDANSKTVHKMTGNSISNPTGDRTT
jgi:hypothetical protein